MQIDKRSFPRTEPPQSTLDSRQRWQEKWPEKQRNEKKSSEEGVPRGNNKLSDAVNSKRRTKNCALDLESCRPLVTLTRGF